MVSTQGSPGSATGQPGTSTSKILRLPSNRQLHYAAIGDPASTTLIVFFSGYMSVGTVPTPLPDPLLHLPSGGTAHYVAPTIPGNGASSPTAPGLPYHASLLRDLDALLTSLYPAGPAAIERFYVGGGSYGSIPAQMVFGADDATTFPWARKLRGLLLLAPFSPFRLHKDYARDMTWTNWVGVGPVAKWVPFGTVQWLASCAMASMLSDVPKSEKFMRDFVFGKMGDEERADCRRWLESRGLTEDEWISEMAEGPRKCTGGNEGGWRGFLEGPKVVHSDWGFKPWELGSERGRALIAAGDEDDLGLGMARWLRNNYQGARLEVVKGGHVATLWHIDEIWLELLQMNARPS